MIRIETTDYESNKEPILSIRFQVFVDEQNVPAELEVDGRDPDCLHGLAWDDDKAVGTGRLLPDGHIGRVAVLQSYRKRGIGATLMKALIEAARERGFPEVVLSSQTRAMPFYDRLGFLRQGEPYMEAGIEHIDMRLVL
ncbi:MAG: GNAT family N-acetyltransferase [Opitutales bacterium TMED158]|nr:MAG: GNAT family N-acetyltransferase [Opitutales bacterium TMED158]